MKWFTIVEQAFAVRDVNYIFQFIRVQEPASPEHPYGNGQDVMRMWDPTREKCLELRFSGGLGTFTESRLLAGDECPAVPAFSDGGGQPGSEPYDPEGVPVSQPPEIPQGEEPQAPQEPAPGDGEKISDDDPEAHTQQQYAGVI